MGTNVINELNKSIDYYENILVSEDLNNKKIVQINSIIKNLNEQINKYKNYSNQENYSLQNNTRAVSNAIYSTAVSAVISWFNAQGYVLSAELLTHARDNTSYNSLYVPYNGRRVIQSPVYKNIVQQSSTSSKGVFPNSGTVVQRDLFYSIHEFHWSKHNYGNVTIIDKYDFSKDLNYETSSIAGVAIRTMYEAQQHGVITPYGIKITN
ncbi:hypothetical protein [Helcococcus sueciensis]|uniref:hypothetical protein n=1 Tax=Helcococcus sueciensis TaxID=241555 RepID=UPI000407CC60|nr:hypothetical protein [Helcococcus sueciensis]